MMQKRTLYSLLLISFVVVFTASVSVADVVTIESKSDLLRCATQSVEVNVEVTSQAVSAIEFVFIVDQAVDCGFLLNMGVNWELPTGVLSDRLPVDLTQADGIAPDTIRFAAMRLQAGDGALNPGTHLAATITFTTSNCCSGTASIDNCPSFAYPSPTGTITTQFIDEATAAIRPVQVVAGMVGIENEIPVLDPIAGDSIEWGTLFVRYPNATDGDMANGCETQNFYKVQGPDSMKVTTITWQTLGKDVCDPKATDIQIAVVDSCGAEDTVSFDVCVYNHPPEITCPEDQLICMGDTLFTQVTAVDTLGSYGPGPYALLYTLESTTCPGVVVVDPATGAITWPTDMAAPFTGTFEICVIVSDQANTCDPCSPENADTCCFEVEVRSMSITIEKVHDAFIGQPTTVSIDMLPGDLYNNWAIAGFDFLIYYDPTALSVLNVTEGEFFTDCGWEYFTWRNGPYGNCGNACPQGYLRIVALSEQNDGANHPDCFINDGGITTATQLAYIDFLVANNYTLECQMVPIKFVWYDCGDNSLSTITGDTLLISRWVYLYYCDNPYVRVDDPTAEFPTFLGAPAECDVFTEKGEPLRQANFFGGGVDIVCSDSIDAVGDINVNGIAYEIADAVMFTNYFVSGLSAFEYEEASIAASDCNLDGIALTVADLVYLIRVIVGDAQAYPKEVAIQGTYTLDGGILAVPAEIDVSGMYLVVEGQIEPELMVNNMEMVYRFDGANTRIIITPDLNATTMPSFSGEFLAGVNGEIISVEAADPNATVLALAWVPSHYNLSQNYPNPFNPTTKIAMDIPKAGDYSLVIYNIQGQVVHTYTGAASDAGRVVYEWDASDFASGVYLYRFTADNFSSVKKAILLK